MKKKNDLLPKISFLGELKGKTIDDGPNKEKYRKLLFVAASNLGGPKTDDIDVAYNWLLTSASETDEDGVVDEVNACRDMVK